MFGLGFSEILIIAIIALVFIGPKQLPQAMKTIGKFVREVTKAKEEFKQTVDHDDSLRSMRDTVDEVKSNIQEKINQVKSDVTHDDDDKEPKA